MRNSFAEIISQLFREMARSVCLFIALFLYDRCSGNILSSIQNKLWQPMPVNNGSPPGFWDWRDRNMVSPVKNQLTCNACWAFSAVASIESHVKIYKKKEYSLSEQFLIDCDKQNAGCGTGSIIKTFADIVTGLGGVLLEEDYFSYSGKKMDCRWSGNAQPLPVVGFRRVLPDEEEMARYVYQYGPLSAAINSASMVDYTHGIDQPSKEKCPPDELNHAILIVGYNVHVSKDGREIVPYWIIKNSWGAEWGDKGFYYLERGTNACGISSDVSFPYVD